MDGLYHRSNFTSITSSLYAVFDVLEHQIAPLLMRVTKFGLHIYAGTQNWNHVIQKFCVLKIKSI